MEENKPFRARLAEIIEIGAAEDRVSRGYDFLITAVVVVSLAAAVLGTFDDIYAAHGALLDAVGLVTAAFFALDYALHLIAAKYIYPRPTEARSVLRYVVSFTGLVDLLSFLPFFLPVFFPAGAVAFRIFHVVRIFRLFRINSYYDSFNAIADVLYKKRQQLASSVFIILVMMLASSLCMYSVEHGAQPEVFRNAFSGLWWSVSTLLTVGYGDIYPVTALGKLLGIVITFLGVGLVAIPTGIISAGFVEQYDRVQRSEKDARSIRLREVRIGGEHPWNALAVSELPISRDTRIVAIRRHGAFLLPEDGTLLETGDVLLLYRERDEKDAL